MKKKFMGIAAITAAALTLSACGGGTDNSSGKPEDNANRSITLWLAGGDTSDELRTYLTDTFKTKTGATLKIEEQAWPDLVTKMSTALPDENNTPDVVEMGNTQSPTFTNVGAFTDLSDMYDELGGDKLLPSFVEAGSVDGKKYTLPYYFGSRYLFTRKDVWKEAGVETPKTLDEFNKAVSTIAEKNPRDIKNFSGLFLGGQDWRNGVSWVFANGGDLAKNVDGKWVSTLSDPNTLKGLTQLQELYKTASKAPSDAKDASPWLYLNDSDQIIEEEKAVGNTSLSSATIMAPGWAHWSIGDLTKDEGGKDVRTWNDDTFGTLVLPGNDGKPAPVLAGGSNIGISAKSKNQDLAKDLMRIIFSEEYQNMLGAAGMGPGNLDYVNSLGDDQFAKAGIASASNSKLTPAAPGWAAVETSLVLEEFFGKIKDSTDLAALAKQYDDRITPQLNLK
ncbi:N,N'-diacetylchitobiose transport system substrate-binding protein [Arthrobacter stackebrandtii]|uniref:N,N'-diacetylchitobiose transport system substrate-binding protein n=1 Tax=Arthrobacter stackebrandtii TaxID=272161 RepID=A0ABS4YSF4_9MICC|nr:extracellular solute-binding protein [Arthrobacter stackebrandtii]MBP2411425.1 N,N'-diacetylchitobiose transport system substrate-binding protein [Arthrobacter stackebrandtii]PYH00290.1 ABC transporter substrate-binding protein [Arthrobacter stackebrandtii]